MAKRITRRQALGQATVAGSAMLVAPQVLRAHQPGKTLGVAIVGAGGMGGYAVDAGCAERVVAVCDIDDNATAGALNAVKERRPGDPAPLTFTDFRRMLDACRKDIDVVLISTPDHTHAPAAIRAIEAGKHVFVQKPMAHNIRECRELARAARRKRVLTQMGNQGHCGEGIRRACEYLWAGAVGSVTETHTILGRNFGGQGTRPDTRPVPYNVHWDSWLGPAPFRGYHEGLHPFSWRSWRDFGTGTIGDMACHNLDALFWALKVGEADKIRVTCLNTKPGSAEMFAQDNVVLYEVPARAGLPPLKVHVYDHGDLKPQVMKDTEKECEVNFGECTLFLGEKGKFWTTGAAGQARILPFEKHAEFAEPQKTLPRAHGGPIEDLFHCIKNGGKPCSNFIDSAGPLTEFALLGHLAQAAGVGVRLEWDVDKMRCTNNTAVNRLVARAYRSGWEV